MTLDEVLETFEGFYEYEPNWNGEGSSAPSNQVISNALAVYGLTRNTDDISIAVTDKGFIRFSWKLDARKVVLDVFDYSAHLKVSFSNGDSDVSIVYSPIAFKSSFIAEDLNTYLTLS